MDPAVTAAIIGAFAMVVAVLIPIALRRRRVASAQPPPAPTSDSATGDTTIETAIRFETAFAVDPVSVKLVLDSFPENARSLRIEWAAESNALLERIPYLLEEASRCEVLVPWKERVLTQFLRLANYLLHKELAYCTFMYMALPPSVREGLPEPWRALVLEETEPEGALAQVME